MSSPHDGADADDARRHWDAWYTGRAVRPQEWHANFDDLRELLERYVLGATRQRRPEEVGWMERVLL